MVKRRRRPPPPKLTRGERNRIADDLARLDAARQELERAHHWLDLGLYREKYDRVRDAFDQFTAAGGVTAEDWAAFVEGDPLQGRVRQEGGLRLVSDNQPRYTGRRRGVGPTAA